MVFDYIDQPYANKAINDTNVNLAIEDMGRHLVNIPCARSSSCLPAKEAFDKEGNLIAPLNTAALDEWIKRWGHHAQYYWFYLERSKKDISFCGENPGTGRFDKMVKQWLDAFVAHAKKLGIHPDQLIFHVLDEPRNDELFDAIAKWNIAMKKANSGIKCWSDPTWENASSSKTISPAFMEMLKTTDIICPHLPACKKIRENIYHIQGNKKTAFFYTASDRTASLLDPYYAYRLQAWHCWANKCSGMGYWAYLSHHQNESDSDWDGFGDSTYHWGMVYLAEGAMVSSKRWEAVREGVEDYECLKMLETELETLKKKRGITMSRAESLLDSASLVAKDYEYPLIYGEYDKDRTLADNIRLQVLDLLSRMKTEAAVEN
ncbi:MAG: DUF4091 domain-containing protein [Verrucomicrobiae bacterium]|nr:DUF4091 domain-containing protein [Verrucomicrobiae bacterium]